MSSRDAETLRLIALAQNGEDEAARIAARNTLIQQNIGLIYQTATRFPSQDRGEHVSDAVEGFIRAINGFDPTRGVKLSTYAVTCMIQTIRRCMHYDRHLIRINQAQKSHSEEVKKFRQAAKGIVSIDDKREDGRAAVLELEGEPVELGEYEPAAFDRLHAAMGILTPDQRLVLTMRLTGKKLRECGRMLGISRERARQLEIDAFLEVQRIMLGVPCKVDCDWEPQEIDALRSGRSLELIASQLGRTVHAVARKASQLGIRMRRRSPLATLMPKKASRARARRETP